MKNKKSRKPDPGGGPGPGVCLEFNHLTATTVCVAGDFNDWRPEVTPMISLGDGRWMKQLALPPGSYEYCLVVDGAWLPDPSANETVPNPFGGVNAVIRVPPDNGVTKLAA